MTTETITTYEITELFFRVEEDGDVEELIGDQSHTFTGTQDEFENHMDESGVSFTEDPFMEDYATVYTRDRNCVTVYHYER